MKVLIFLFAFIQLLLAAATNTKTATDAQYKSIWKKFKDDCRAQCTKRGGVYCGKQDWQRCCQSQKYCRKYTFQNKPLIKCFVKKILKFQVKIKQEMRKCW